MRDYYSNIFNYIAVKVRIRYKICRNIKMIGIHMSKDTATKLLNFAKKHGATNAEVVYATGTNSEVRILNGKPEAFETASSDAIGLRAIVGKKQAVTTTSDLSDTALDMLAEQACAMAKASTEDPHLVLANEDSIVEQDGTFLESLQLNDTKEKPSVEMLQTIAKELEAKGLDHPQISKSNGSWASSSTGQFEVLSTTGFKGGYTTTSYGTGLTLLAGSGLHMVRDGAHSFTRHFEDLRNIEEIAAEASESVAKKLGAKPIEGGKLPVIYDRKVASSLLGHLAGAINGAAIARGSSFLKDSLEQQLFDKNVTVTDDPHMVRGLSSKPFDSEGLANRKQNIIESGILKTWILDLTTAHKLGLESTGHASRGIGSLPSPSTTNFYLEAGDQSPEEMIKNIDRGFFVTGLIGSGVNGITGDYSRGFEGFLIENGVLTTPVQEMTLAGNLKDMYKNLAPANDLIFDKSMCSPTVLINGMYVAGK